MSISDSELTPELSPIVTTSGGLLKQARERAGLTAEYVAKELHMSLSKVRSLEADDYSSLNANTFIRGYLRAYANLLKLDSAPIIAAYEQQAVARGLIAEQQYPITKDSSPKKLWGFVAALVVLLVGLWLISVWFFDNQVERPIVASPATVIQPAVSVGPGLPAPVIAEDETRGEQTNVSESPAANEANAVEPAAEVIEKNSAASSAAAITVKTLDKLAFVFAEECWLEVSDAQGDVLATELQRAGSILTLQGTAPFNVKLGNAPAARATLNGEEVAINPAAGAKVLIISVGE